MINKVHYITQITMEDKIIIIGSYFITFLLGRIYGIYGARKIVDKSIRDYFKNK